MKFGKIYTFENKDEAKNLIGEFVAFSNNYAEIFNFNGKRYDSGMLNEIKETGKFPFVVAKKEVQFIRRMERTKYLEIMDYKGIKHETDIDLDNLDEIDTIFISVVSGDEIATVAYKNGQSVTIDSDHLAKNQRCQHDYDGGYILYSSHINRLEEFEERNTSYDLS